MINRNNARKNTVEVRKSSRTGNHSIVAMTRCQFFSKCYVVSKPKALKDFSSTVYVFALLFQERLSLKSKNGQAKIPIATMSSDSFPLPKFTMIA